MIPIGVWAVLVVGAIVWGRHVPRDALHFGNIPPLFGGLRHHPLTYRLLPATAVAVTLVVGLPRIAATMRWRQLLLVAWVSSGVWAVALAASDGWDRIGQPLNTRYEYLPAVSRVGSVHEFLQTFVARIPTYPTHVKGHGPLALLAFWALAKLGLPQSWAAGAMVIAVGTSAVVAVGITVRVLVGEEPARRALPFLALMPAVLWIATSADAMFLGISAWGVAVLALATTRSGRAAALSAAGSGVVFGAALYMTYGLLALATLPLAVIVLRRRFDLIAPVLVGLAIVVLIFSVEGFNYLSGFQATQRAWSHGVGPERSRPYFFVSNLADLALGIGPAIAIALSRLRDRRLMLLVGAVSVSLAAGNLSGYERGEVERIWLPFMPWLVIAVADLPLRRWQVRTLLGLQVATALVIQGLVYLNW